VTKRKKRKPLEITGLDLQEEEKTKQKDREEKQTKHKDREEENMKNKDMKEEMKKKKSKEEVKLHHLKTPPLR
jgi:hypothetical protein